MQNAQNVQQVHKKKLEIFNALIVQKLIYLNQDPRLVWINVQQDQLQVAINLTHLQQAIDILKE